MHPAIDDISELSDLDRTTPFIDECYGDWITDETGGYAYKMAVDKSVWHTNIDGKQMYVSPKDVRLDVLMKNDVICDYFKEKGYATNWESKKLHLHPEILLYDYAGEIGEEAFEALVCHYISLDGKSFNHLDGTDYELADFIVRDRNGKNLVAFDVKNMNPEADHFDRSGDLPIVEKLKLKEKRLCCPVILVNMLKINKTGMNDTKEILGMIDNNGAIQYDAIERIQTLING